MRRRGTESRKTHPDRHVLFLLLPHTYVRTYACYGDGGGGERDGGAAWVAFFVGSGGREEGRKKERVAKNGAKKTFLSLGRREGGGDGKKTPLLVSRLLAPGLFWSPGGLSGLRGKGRAPPPPDARKGCGGGEGKGLMRGRGPLKRGKRDFFFVPPFVFMLFLHWLCCRVRKLVFAFFVADWLFCWSDNPGSLFFCRSVERGKDLIDKGGENSRGERRRKI